MSGIILRDATLDDAFAVHQMLRALAEEVGEGAAFAATQADIERDVFGRAPAYEAVLASLEGRPAGLTTYFTTYSTYKGRPCLHVNDLFVQPWARRDGIARALFALVCRRAAARDCCRVELKVLDNNPARAFYEAIGMGQSREVTYTLTEEALGRLAGE